MSLQVIREQQLLLNYHYKILNMKVRALVVEDKPANRENLIGMLQMHCPQVVIIGEAADNEEALGKINNLNPDLVFLDVRMPGGNIFTMLEQIREIRFGIIFVTAYDEYAFRAFQFNALDYLLKPIDLYKLIESVDRAIESIRLKEENVRLRNLVENRKRTDQDKRIALPQEDKIDFIPVRQIIRCQSESNYTRFFLDSGLVIMVSRTLKEFELALESCGFIRTHQSHLVNSIHVKTLVKRDGGYLKMSDGSPVPISRIRREGLDKMIL
jgi:two-component system, LytTR family, response regulator